MLITPYEKIWDMPVDGGSAKTEKRAPRWFGNFAWVVITAVFKLCFRLKVDGRESLRAFKGETGLVVVGNHTSFLDVVCMYITSRPSQWIRFMGREDLFTKAGGLLGHILSRVGAFPVKRDSADRTSIKRATNMLKDGEIVGIMPEGTRRGKSNRAPRMHAGAAFIARMGHAPILPMTVRNAEYVKQKRKMLRFPKISVEYGTPILVSDFDFLPKDERLEACTWYAMREVFALSRNIPADQVPMAELFPEDKDYSEVFAEHPVPKHTSEELVADIRAKRAEKAAKEAAKALKAAQADDAAESAAAECASEKAEG